MIVDKDSDDDNNDDDDGTHCQPRIIAATK